MNQAGKRDSIHGRSRPAWPTAVRAAILFAPSDDRSDGLVVHFLDYAIFTVLQLTSVSNASFSVTDLIVNGEFRPALAIGSMSDRFYPLRLPVQMCHGSSLGVALRAPATVELSACYPKMPASVVVSTDRGDFAFHAGELIHPNGGPRPF
jgi:hypothetical protein